MLCQTDDLASGITYRTVGGRAVRLAKGAGWTPRPRCLKGVGLLFGDVSVRETVVNPSLDLRQEPGDTVPAQPDPFRELACALQPLDMLRRVWDAA